MTMMEVGARYSGSLHIDPGGEGLRAQIEISEKTVTISIRNGETFSYRHSDIRGRAFDTRTVVLDIRDDDDLYFVADEPFLFTGYALPALQGLASRDEQDSATVVTETSWKLPVIGTNIGKSPSSPEPPPPRQKRKKRDRGTCAHEWRSLNLSAGLVRRVCNTCGTVSIDLRS